MASVDKHDLYELDVLSHVEKTSRLSNRQLARKLGVSVRLAHQLLKRMVHKGLLHVRVVNSRRWDYFLTPQGIAEKARLTMEFFEFSMHFYREARRRSSQVCRDLAEAGHGQVAFLGTGDLAEIAFLGVREWGLELTAVYAGEGGETFMDVPVRSEEALREISPETPVIVCMYDARHPMKEGFLPEGIDKSGNMYWVFQ